MSRRQVVSRLLFGVVFVLGMMPPGSAPQTEAAPASSIVPPTLNNRYIVTLRDDLVGVADVADRFAAADTGIHIDQIYQSALNGFAAEIPADQLVRIATDPRVVSVEPDRPVYTQGQTVTTGVKWIAADRNKLAKIDGKDGTGERVDIDIAILDTGIGPNSDLNVVGGYDCSGNGIITDVDGHGTHVAGIAAAYDNDRGIVGVAPGARIWSVRVLGNDLSLWSSVICGLNWVTEHADTIEVVNMSLGDGYGSDPTCSSTALHRAVCNTVAARVTIVVAAGNYWPNGVDNSGGVPAQYNEVITVSAIADSDGKPGGLGPATSDGLDDHRANFSSWGAFVDIAAPGVDTYSTAPNNGSSVMSGTSFATPHVSGAATLYIAKHGRVGPSAVRAGLIAEREKGHIPGDPDGYDEGIVNVGDLTYGSLTLGASSGKSRDFVTFSLSGFKANSSVDLQWDGTTLLTVKANGSGKATGSMTIPNATRGAHVVTVVSSNRLASVPFTVKSLLLVSPTTGSAYVEVGVTIRGALADERLTVSFFNGSRASTLATVTASYTGSATLKVKVPPAFIGKHMVEVAGTKGTSISTTYTVTPSMSVRPSSLNPGGTATVTMRGFAPDSAISLRWYEGDTARTLVNGRTSSAGSWTVAFTIPANASKGSHRLRAIDAAGNGLTMTVSVAGAAKAAEESAPHPRATDEPTATVAAPLESPEATPTVTETPTSDATPYSVRRGTQSRGATSARAVVDGDLTSSWSATTGDDRLTYLMLDLGRVQPVNTIRWYLNEGASVPGMTIQVSTNRREWTTLDTPVGLTGWNEVGQLRLSVRYVRMTFEGVPDGTVIAGLAEVEVVG